jgi:hypothetical protein
VEARSPGRPLRRLSTETKQAFKSTEFWVFVVVFIGILLAGTVDDSEGTQFGADDVWLYITLLTIGYMVSRGLAKSGSRDPYTEQPAGADGDSVTDRVKAAAHVLTEGQSGSGAATSHDAPPHDVGGGARA